MISQDFKKTLQPYPVISMNNHVNDNRNYTDYPFVGVGVVAWRKDKFILIQRAKPPMFGEWSLPGGRQELGETTKEAAYREVMEETSIHIDIVGLVDVVDSIQKDEQGNIKYHATLVDYAAVYISGTPRAGDDAMGVGWFTLDELPTLKLWEETNRIIRRSAQLVRLV